MACEHGELVRTVRLASEAFVLVRSGRPEQEALARFTELPRVAAALSLDTPFILSSRLMTDLSTRVVIRPDLEVGGEEFVVMAGPCAVETDEQVRGTARSVRESGARVLRGGAFKPRTSPFSFQGHRLAGLEILQRAGQEAGLPIVSEVMATQDLDEVVQSVDILQVGMRNALNYSLLTAIGRHPGRPPVLLKRGVGSTLDELLCAADYVLQGGNPNVLLCLRGTLNGLGHSRASLNIADIPALRRLTHLPIIVDPSHAAGRRDLVPAMSQAALVAGADGLLVEVHIKPEEALVDGPQSLTPHGFASMMQRLRDLSRVMGRTMHSDREPEESSEPEHPSHTYGNLQV